jgi:phage N-6-adenine-methyltransferase
MVNMKSGMFTSIDSCAETPIELFKQLDEEFHFTLDSCAVPETAKCKKYYTPQTDAFAQKWKGNVWMNPPYGRTIGKWMKKAYEESQTNAKVVVCLIPSRTDTKWWHDYCMNGEIRFIKGRLKFNGYGKSAPFPSALVVFRKK